MSCVDRERFPPVTRSHDRPKTDRLEGLDALRGLAAMIILVFHAGKNFHIPAVFPHGYLVVDFFFMLSGYVMARSYEDKFRGGLSGVRFFARRYARLWPTMAIGGLVALPLLLVADTEHALTIAAFGLMLIPVFTTKDVFPLNGPTWSIFFELFSNLVHGFLLWRLSNKALMVTISIIIILLVVQIQIFGGYSLGPSPANFVGGFTRVLLSYVIGIMLFRIWGDTPPFALPGPVALLLMPLAIVGTSFLFSGNWIVQLGFVLAICPLLLAGGLSMTASRWMPIAGALSFPLYAVHFPIMMVCVAFGFGASSAVAASLAAAAAIASPSLIYARRRESPACV